MELVTTTISKTVLKEMSKKMFDDLGKAVVDLEKEIMMVDAGMHSDMELVSFDQ